MRVAALVLLVYAAQVLAAGAPDAFEIARELARSGAPNLALIRVEQSQSADRSNPHWAEWEVLHLHLLSQLGRYSAVLERAAVLPASMPVSSLRACLELAIKAAVMAAQGSIARQYAARVLWQLSASPALFKRIRLLVIESYVADTNGDAAFRSMLKFQQDYKPVDGETTTLFVEALLELGMPREAVNWLGSLDDESPLKLLLRLRNDLVSANAAAARARSMLAKEDSADNWRVLLEVAVRQKNPALQIRAREHMLQLATAMNVKRRTALTRDLWRTYVAGAQKIGNQKQLLTGDDASWMDVAARRSNTDPEVSRAFLAFVAQRGQTPEARDRAQLLMVESLRSMRLGLVALRLFADLGAARHELSGKLRYLLGTIAEEHNLPQVALRYWQALDVPADVPVIEWRFRVAQALIHAGMIDRGVALLRAVITARGAASARTPERSVDLVQDLLEAGRPDVANELFSALLPVVEGAQRRKVLFGLGHINEIRGQPAAAADHYLRSALLADTVVPDVLALRSRLLAARNLARAGYREDARAQFLWVIENTRDSAQLEVARRELGKL